MSLRLPFLALALSYILLAAFTTLTYVNLKSRTQDSSNPMRENLDAYVVRHHNSVLRASLTGAGSIASRTVQAVNFPGMIGEVVASFAMRTWPDSWRPHSFGPSPAGLFVWRGFIFPLYCLPFWWFGGLGVDAFRRQRNLHWAVLLLGTLLAGFFAFILIGLGITTGTRGYGDMAFVFLGLTPWTGLLTLFPITWWRTIRRKRMS